MGYVYIVLIALFLFVSFMAGYIDATKEVTAHYRKIVKRYQDRCLKAELELYRLRNKK